MGKKYIIELNDDCQSEFKGIMALGLTQEKQISVELIPEEELTRYTEPDLEQVKADVWKCAGKIAYMYSEERKKVFGENLIQNIYDIYSASEAIEKIRQYEQEKDRQARIEYNFDEIKDVLETTAKECNVSLDEIAEVLQKMKEANNG